MAGWVGLAFDADFVFARFAFALDRWRDRADNGRIAHPHHMIGDRVRFTLASIRWIAHARLALK